MKRLILFLLLAVGLFSCSEDDFLGTQPQQKSINFVTEELSLKIAENIYLGTNPSSVPRKISKEQEKGRKVSRILPVKDENNEIVFYIINYEGSGFLILSADNRISPILAYSDTAEFRTNASSYSSGLVEWLSSTKEAVEYVRDNNLTQSESLKAEWDYVSSSISDPSTGIEDPTGPEICSGYPLPIQPERVEPLLTTEWHQRCGFNDFMPTMSCDVPCGRALAGCVPIAIAQVMKYHEYPTTYNWGDMPNTTGTTTTALLVKDIHDAISDINYKCDVTGVDTDYNKAGVFTNHFGYSTANQSSFNKETVMSNLRKGMPVILSGGRNDGWIINDYEDGHMWVCDGFNRTFTWGNDCETGWSNLYFNMNWGWYDGRENGWYTYNNFDPAGHDFNFKVKMVHNIKP